MYRFDCFYCEKINNLTLKHPQYTQLFLVFTNINEQYTYFVQSTKMDCFKMLEAAAP